MFTAPPSLCTGDCDRRLFWFSCVCVCMCVGVYTTINNNNCVSEKGTKVTVTMVSDPQISDLEPVTDLNLSELLFKVLVAAVHGATRARGGTVVTSVGAWGAGATGGLRLGGGAWVQRVIVTAYYNDTHDTAIIMIKR